ncbi:hypothetical protein WA158_005295 [Blastocystis sp. Blastoise]
MLPTVSQEKREHPVFKYLPLGAVITSIVALLFSVVAITMSLVPAKEQPVPNPWDSPMTFSVANKYNITSSDVGKVVSFDNDGGLYLGSGTTIYKDVYKDDTTSAKTLKFTSVNDQIAVAAFDGQIRVFLMNEDDTVKKSFDFSVPDSLVPDDLITLHDNVVLLLSSNTILPLYVNLNNNNVAIIFGKASKYTENKTEKPYMDNLDSSCIVISYIDENKNISATVGCITGTQEETTIKFMDNKPYAPNHQFHALSGLSIHKFVVAYAVDGNSTSLVDKLSFRLGSYDNNILTFGPELVYEHHGSFGFFDMDNINDYLSIITYIDEQTDNGLVSLLVKYNSDKDELEFGTFFDVQDGGGSGKTLNGMYQFINLRILSDTRFGIFYSNILNGGTMCFAMLEITPALDMVALGPEYILTDPIDDLKNDYYACGEAYVNDEKFYLIESLISNSKPSISLLVGEVLSNPLGLVKEVNSTTLTIASSGVYTLTNQNKLTPGRYYYSNSNGYLIEGEFVGTGSIEGITVYIDKNNQILSLDNRIGYAITTNQLFIEREY